MRRVPIVRSPVVLMSVGLAWVPGCSTPPLADQGEAAVMPLERMAQPEAEDGRPAGQGVDTPATGSSAEADIVTRPADDPPVPDPGDDRVELSRDPGVPAWFHDELRDDDGLIVAGGTAVSGDFRAARRAALDRGRAALAEVVGQDSATRAVVTRGAAYRVEAGFRVYVMLSAEPTGDDEE